MNQRASANCAGTSDSRFELFRPSLVLHKTADRSLSVDYSRYLASRIPHSRLIELRGTDPMVSFEHPDDLPDAVEAFMTGRMPQHEPDRGVATILFTDIVGATSTAVGLGDRQWAALLARHEDVLRRTISSHGGRVVDTAGDGVFSLFGAPARAIQCALSIRASLADLQLQVRCGVHTGEVEHRGPGVTGVAVHLAARIVARAVPGEILVSRTVKDLMAGSDTAFRDRGAHDLRGFPEPWHLFAIVQEIE